MIYYYDLFYRKLSLLSNQKISPCRNINNTHIYLASYKTANVNKIKLSYRFISLYGGDIAT